MRTLRAAVTADPVPVRIPAIVAAVQRLRCKSCCHHWSVATRRRWLRREVRGCRLTQQMGDGVQV